MPYTIEEDLAYFNEWVESAFEMHHAGKGRIALGEGRRAAEAACSIILNLHWPEARVKAAIGDDRLQDHIALIQRSGLAPNPVISALHALRTVGNNASHFRNVVTAHDVEFGIISLKLLLLHMYEDVLRMPLPKKLSESMQGTRQRKRLEEEIEAQVARILDARLITGSVASPLDEQPAEPLPTVPEAPPVVLPEASAAGIEASAAVPPVDAPVSTTNEVVVPPQESHKPRYRLLAMGLLAMVILAGSVLLYLKNASGPTEEASASAVPENSAATYSGGVDVLIIPFQVLQNDTRLDLRVEELIRKRLEERAGQLPLPLTVRIAEPRDQAIQKPEALALARSHDASLVYFGELYEPLPNDSGTILIRFAAVEPHERLYGEVGPEKFRVLTDSGAVRIQLGVQAMAEVVMADQLFAAMRYSEALALLHSTPMANATERMAVHLSRSMAYRQLDDPQGQEREARAAIAVGDNGTGHQLLAQALFAQGDTAGAIHTYEKVIAMAPADPEPIILLAHVVGNENAGKYHDARRWKQLVDIALSLDPNIADAWSMRGVMHANAGDHRSARQAFSRALALDPWHVDAKLGMAKALMTVAPYDEAGAIALLKEVLAYDGSNVKGLLMLADLVTNGTYKDPALGQTLYQQAQQVSGRYSVFARRGEAKAAYEKGDLARAQQLYLEIFALDTTDITVGNHLGATFFKLGDHRTAERILLQLWQLDSMHHTTNANLGHAYLSAPPPINDLQKAEYHTTKALLTNPGTIHVRRDLGIIYYKQRKFKESMIELEKVLQQQPNNYDGLKYMGLAYHHTGRADLAIPFYEKVLTVRPQDGDIHGNIASAYVQMGQKYYPQALSHQKKSFDRNPDARNHGNIAEIYRLLDDPHSCRKYYAKAQAMDPHFHDQLIEEWLLRKGN